MKSKKKPWKLVFTRKINKNSDTFSAWYHTQEEAYEFKKKWEDQFFIKGNAVFSKIYLKLKKIDRLGM